ncbi:MAG: M14 family metallopeptidase [Proteobacteria bacterium]|nr:M14 family metallopeptidase [Pseudomonadota bacterium]
MLRAALTVVVLCLGQLSRAIPARAQPATSPKVFFGKQLGQDRFLAPYPKVLRYLRHLAASSERISIESAGRSTLGNEMPVVVLTSARNQKRLGHYRQIARQLANPDRLPPAKAAELVQEGKVIVLVTCTIHSTEVGCTQMASEFAHQFAVATDPIVKRWMDDVILLLMPSINPDGQIMVVDWYNKHLGTQYEGGRMPWLYHQYVGHDTNRDFYMLTQKETRNVNQLLYRRWFPQVFLDEHQMGSTGPRMFVPPQTDPLAPEVHSMIFRLADLLGTQMSLRLEEAGKLGVGHNMIYDSYWPGATRNTAWWKNVTGLLTEVASARIASPIYIEPGELTGQGKGLPEYTRRANFPSPWRGGWWRLWDIIDYELIATWSLVESCSRYRADLLRGFYRMGREAAEAGRRRAPYAWVIPPKQHDPVAAGKLVDLLARHGVRVHEAREPLRVGAASYPAGTPVIPAAQPYRAFLLTMLRPQRYPEVVPYAGGPVIPPYDVTAWSLPILMGVDVVEADSPVEAKLAPKRDSTAPARLASGPGGYLISHAADTVFTALNRLLKQRRKAYWLKQAPAGGAVGEVYLPPEGLSRQALAELASGLSLRIKPLAKKPTGAAYAVGRTRVGLYKPWVASMDEGWTRWLLEQYEFDFVTLDNAAFRGGGFGKGVDVLLFPDVNRHIIAMGELDCKGKADPRCERRRRRWTPLPPPYAGGIDGDANGKLERPGGKKIAAWIRRGGTLVALDSSTEYFIQLLKLPVVNALDGVARDEFHCPGSMLRLLVDTTHPLGFGMRNKEAGYFATSPAFRTFIPHAGFRRRVVARYPGDERDILVSGYLKGGKLLERRAAVVELRVGKGRVVLIGFRAQHRAQPHRTFKLLFNSLYLPRLREVVL